jgi:hypothetical protein
MWDLLIEQSGKHAAAGLAPEAVPAVEAIIIREGGLFIKLLHQVRDISCSGREAVRREETRDAGLDGIRMAPAFAREAPGGRLKDERNSVHRASQEFADRKEAQIRRHRNQSDFF